MGKTRQRAAGSTRVMETNVPIVNNESCDLFCSIQKQLARGSNQDGGKGFPTQKLRIELRLILPSMAATVDQRDLVNDFESRHLSLTE